MGFIVLSLRLKASEYGEDSRNALLSSWVMIDSSRYEEVRRLLLYASPCAPPTVDCDAVAVLVLVQRFIAMHTSLRNPEP